MPSAQTAAATEAVLEYAAQRDARKPMRLARAVKTTRIALGDGQVTLDQVAPDPEAWAEALAAKLPPFTPAEAAVAGKLAAILDARRDDGPVAA